MLYQKPPFVNLILKTDIWGVTREKNEKSNNLGFTIFFSKHTICFVNTKNCCYSKRQLFRANTLFVLWDRLQNFFFNFRDLFYIFLRQFWLEPKRIFLKIPKCACFRLHFVALVFRTLKPKLYHEQRQPFCSHNQNCKYDDLIFITNKRRVFCSNT